MKKHDTIVLLADIGNTSIKLGFANKQKILHAFSLPTKSQYSMDSLGLFLMQMLAKTGYSKVSFVALCSVVPELTAIFKNAVLRYFEIEAAVFPEDFSIDMENSYENPHEVGTDRLMAAYAARMLYPKAKGIISVDYGTATTFDCVAENKYLGGLICPGLLSSHNALAQGTAKLPHINLQLNADKDTHIPLIGKNTVTSMSNGFIFGFIAMTDGLCERLKKQLPKPLVIIATGGFAKDLQKLSNAIQHTHPDLILEGLRLASAPLLK